MLFIKKPKTRLTDLITDDYTDIHSHLLPGIDDGATDENDSLSMIKALREYGFSQFITTPHILPGIWNNTREVIEEKEKSTLDFLKKQGITLDFRAAAEHMIDNAFTELFTSGPLLTLKDNYVLVEMSYINAPINLYDIIFKLRVAEYIPVLAHPERYLFFHQKPEEYKRLKRAGCLFQLNLLSVTGYYGIEVLKTAEKLLNEGMIDYTGSDVHHSRHVENLKNTVPLKNTAYLRQAIKNNAFFKF